MISFTRFRLKNGLTVLVHEDPSAPMAVVNILYKVGARDEHPKRTGFAHLFEHLMFEGSANIPNFDEPIERCGGSNNAFTNNDYTNYYDIVPPNNLETVFWLESDRMLELDFNPKKLAVQKKVVCEEFRERYLNRPYGDVDMRLRALAYKKHPYRWPTIGKSLKHIETARLEEVKSFFYRYYCPNNAIMAVAGQVETKTVRHLARKWFGDIPAGKPVSRDIPEESDQRKSREAKVQANVPLDALYMAFHMPERRHPDYYVCDLLTDILAGNQSSRLYRKLVKEQELFNEIDAYITGSLDSGLLIIEGKLNEGIPLAQGKAEVWQVLEDVKEEVREPEAKKVKRKREVALLASTVSVPARAHELAYFEMLGDAAMLSEEPGRYSEVTAERLRQVAASIFRENNVATLRYLSRGH